MVLIGITGPTGAGKTTLLREVEALGGAVIDCDAVYHELLEHDPFLQRELERRFGPLRGENGAIDRKRLGTIVFGDPEKLALLNDVVLTVIVDRTRALVEDYRRQDKYLGALVGRVANRIVFMEGGVIVEEGSPDEFFDHPKTERAQKFLRTFTFDSVK